MILEILLAGRNTTHWNSSLLLGNRRKLKEPSHRNGTKVNFDINSEIFSKISEPALPKSAYKSENGYIKGIRVGNF
jgi:hypothetical protein